MSSHGGEQDEEHFYDCQEIVEPTGGRGTGDEKDREGRLEDCHKIDRMTDTRDRQEEKEEKEAQGDRQKEEGLREEASGDRQQQEDDALQDSDSELKESGKEVEFDDEYLREVEKELTDEEKEVKLSLVCPFSRSWWKLRKGRIIAMKQVFGSFTCRCRRRIYPDVML